MPGYYVHFAACNPDAKKNRSFVIGVEAPDILKKYVKLFGIDGARDKYNRIKTDEMPEFEFFVQRLLQKEVAGEGTGMHYGTSSSPDVFKFWNSLSDEEKNNPFFKGYLWHLITDMLVYKRLNIGAKFNKFAEEHKNSEDFAKLRAIEVDKLHADWDKTNEMVRNTYCDVIPTYEVKELDVVKFIDSDSFDYVDWTILKRTIDFLRTFDPLKDNLNYIIRVIMMAK